MQRKCKNHSSVDYKEIMNFDFLKVQKFFEELILDGWKKGSFQGHNVIHLSYWKVIIQFFQRQTDSSLQCFGKPSIDWGLSLIGGQSSHLSNEQTWIITTDSF